METPPDATIPHPVYRAGLTGHIFELFDLLPSDFCLLYKL